MSDFFYCLLAEVIEEKFNIPLTAAQVRMIDEHHGGEVTQEILIKYMQYVEE